MKEGFCRKCEGEEEDDLKLNGWRRKKLPLQNSIQKKNSKRMQIPFMMWHNPSEYVAECQVDR